MNPVLHGLVVDPFEWPHSSLTDYVREGYYPDSTGLVAMVDVEGGLGE
jgi:hypothetical protein